MKDFLKAFSFVLIIGALLIIIGLKNLDSPVMDCQQYIELNHLNQEVCKE